MAKIAELHNGTQIHFPDDMPDHEMDAAVHRHLGVKQPPSAEHKTQIIAHAAHVEATNSVAAAMKEGMDGLLGPLSGLADAVEQDLPKLVASIDKLTAMMETVSSIFQGSNINKGV